MALMQHPGHSTNYRRASEIMPLLSHLFYSDLNILLYKSVTLSSFFCFPTMSVTSTPFWVQTQRHGATDGSRISSAVGREKWHRHKVHWLKSTHAFSNCSKLCLVKGPKTQNVCVSVCEGRDTIKFFISLTTSLVAPESLKATTDFVDMS